MKMAKLKLQDILFLKQGNQYLFLTSLFNLIKKFWFNYSGDDIPPFIKLKLIYKAKLHFMS
ncbi:MAG: hypothetical protein D5R97_06405 [Candidatus Syntrophonatronum acetioxidans]|uniref:Uncharacterized protein n=1 Tax=Candidatus Syntrophonatronum acetioxidans TaxID=1795816 RepID=A0A424YDV5_9FIRM|nr:MAG: hypothetical protein D5R97_06405 [Candidatus Syntrophonatronum acetioxidans]